MASVYEIYSADRLLPDVPGPFVVRFMEVYEDPVATADFWFGIDKHRKEARLKIAKERRKRERARAKAASSAPGAAGPADAAGATGDVSVGSADVDDKAESEDAEEWGDPDVEPVPEDEERDEDILGPNGGEGEDVAIDDFELEAALSEELDYYWCGGGESYGGEGGDDEDEDRRYSGVRFFVARRRSAVATEPRRI